MRMKPSTRLTELFNDCMIFLTKTISRYATTVLLLNKEIHFPEIVAAIRRALDPQQPFESLITRPLIAGHGLLRYMRELHAWVVGDIPSIQNTLEAFSLSNLSNKEAAYLHKNHAMIAEHHQSFFGAWIESVERDGCFIPPFEGYADHVSTSPYQKELEYIMHTAWSAWRHSKQAFDPSLYLFLTDLFLCLRSPDPDSCSRKLRSCLQEYEMTDLILDLESRLLSLFSRQDPEAHQSLQEHVRFFECKINMYTQVLREFGQST